MAVLPPERMAYMISPVAVLTTKSRTWPRAEPLWSLTESEPIWPRISAEEVAVAELEPPVTGMLRFWLAQ